MHRILFLLLAAPFWLQFVFAGGLVYFGFTSQQSAQIRFAQQAELLQSAPPETIAIDDFAGKYDHKAPKEVSVTAQLALDHNTRLIRKRNFITTGEDLLYVLVDPEAPAGETVARGAIVIDPDEKDRFTDWAMENMTTFGGSGPVVQIDGLLSGGTQTSMVSDALKEQGMTKGPNFFFITPYLEGREAALIKSPMRGSTTQCHSTTARCSLPCSGWRNWFIVAACRPNRPKRQCPRLAATYATPSNMVPQS